MARACAGHGRWCVLVVLNWQTRLSLLDRFELVNHLHEFGFDRLIVGMGGGFDVFCGLPVYFELRRRGQQVHLANFSFSDIANFGEGIRFTETL